MELLEHSGKAVLQAAGIMVPKGLVAATADEAAQAADEIGVPVVIKSQVPAGRRGKGGGIKYAASPDQARVVAESLLAATISGFPVAAVLVEEQAAIDQELYVAVMSDSTSKGPLVLFSTEGGIDIEDVHAASPSSIIRQVIDIRRGLDEQEAERLVRRADAGWSESIVEQLAETLANLYRAYLRVDADLIEINPLALTRDGQVRALDCKLSIDPGATPRHPDLVKKAATYLPQSGTDLERRGRDAGFLFIELGGNVGILANGAGLTMATLDAVEYYGGSAANFLEIGGNAYERATEALGLVLSNPRVKSLLVNFCGAFARTDVMTEGVVGAIEDLQPGLPISFSIHGTGEERAVLLVQERLGLQPHDLMDNAVQEAVAGAASR